MTSCLRTLGLSLLMSGLFASYAMSADVYDFENGLGAWQGGVDTPDARIISGDFLGRAGKIVQLTATDTGSATLSLAQPTDLSRVAAIKLDVFIPKTNANIHVAACFADMDELWSQTWRRFTPIQGEWSTIIIDLRPDAAEIESVGHSRPWGPYLAKEVQEVAIRVFSDKPIHSSIYLDNITFAPAVSDKTPQRVLNFEITDKRVGQYEKFEITFELSRVYDNPYDPNQIDVMGHFLTPSGKTISIPGFFFQDYFRRIHDKVERLIPIGPPRWKIRFAPREIGTYSYWIAVSDSEQVTTSPETFACVKSENPGFLRVCVTDPRYFEFENGRFFYPIGHNIPATYNLKGAVHLGIKPEQHEGTYAYDRFLDGMKRGRENFARIWLGAWSFGLEWSRSYDRSYRGLGRYNQENAWRLDYVLNKAKNNDVYVQLALTTFGHFRSAEFEGDWAYSPYSIRNGGPLNTPEQFWSHNRSQEIYQRMVRYCMARWGYSTQIAAWEICNEVDLVTSYKRCKSFIIRWHKLCAKTIETFDPNSHLITTNFSNIRIEQAILALPEISYSSTNWYATQIPLILRTDIFPTKSVFNKPAIMAECGYDFKGSRPETTERYLHLCLWSTYMIPFGGAGLSWWWDFLDDRNLYERFKPLAEFAEGEDRRNRNLSMSKGNILDAQDISIPLLAVDTLQNNQSAYFWIYERRLIRAESEGDFEPKPRVDVALELQTIQDGTYQVEFWDTHKGGLVKQLTAEAKNGTLRCQVPPFTSDIAGKVKPCVAN